MEPENVRIVIENKGDKALVVAPELVRITPPLEREEKVESRIEDQLKMELEEKEEVISPEDLQKKVEERLEFARLREKEKVALFSEAKQSVLLGGTSKRAWFIAEKEPITGKLLQSQVEKRNITVLPGERKETELKITPGITKELKVKEKIRLVSGDQIAFEKEVEFSPEKRLGTAAAVVDGALEIYAVILSNPEQQKYSLEIRILHIDNTTKTKESVFEEVYGPYLSPLTEGIVLTQKLIPGPLLVRGDYLVKATLYGELTAEQEIPVRIDVEAEAGLPPRILSVERRALAQQVNVSVSLENNGSIPLVLTPEITSATTELPTATTAAAQERISQTISKKALAAGLSLSEKQKEELLNEQLETLKIMEKEKVLPLEPARQTRFFSEEILLGMEPSAEMPTGSALKTKFETTPLILQPGEKISSSLKVTPGISAQAKPRKEKIILASANGEKIQKEVEIIPEARLGTIVESSGDALDLYLIVPAHPEAGKQTDKYSLELDILKEDNLNQKMVFSELYGPYTVSLKKGGMFAQQLRSNLEEGEYLVKTRVYQRGYIAAEQEFKVNLTARELPSIKEVSLPLTGKAYAPAEKVNISRWLILVLITLVVGILLGGSYYALATRRVLIAPVKLPERAIEKPIQRVYEETVAVVTKIKAEPQLTREIEQLNQQLEKLSSAPERIEQARIVNTPRSPVEEIKRGESKPLYKPISIIPLKVTPQRIELEEELFRVKAELAKVEQTMPEPVRVITKAAEKEKKSWWKRMFLK